MKIVNKIAFLVHEPVMYVHYSDVWKEMDCNSFVIVLLGSFMSDCSGKHGVRDFLNKIQLLGYEHVYLNELLSSKTRYLYVISNHVMGDKKTSAKTPAQSLKHNIKNQVKHLLNIGNYFRRYSRKSIVQLSDSTQYIPLQVGIKQIRFMYGADISDGWSLDSWNEIYDLFLCHGPNDEMELKKRFKGKTAIMGYPRYDGYFSPDLNVDNVISEFDIDQTKQTILWMPTMDSYGDSVCSIPYFAKAISALADEYNVIVRPHPITFRVDPSAIELLELLQYKIDREATRDMNKLFKVADAVMCDQGGSAFGALYLCKKLLLLDIPNKSDATMVKNSSNLALMQHYPVIEVNDVDKVRSLLKNDAYWDTCLTEGRKLSDKYFADYRGNASKKTARILADLENILS